MYGMYNISTPLLVVCYIPEAQWIWFFPTLQGTEKEVPKVYFLSLPREKFLLPKITGLVATEHL